MSATAKYRQAEWRPGPEYRIVCDCQRHRRRDRSVWHRSLRIATRSVALLVGVPLAFAAFDFPTEAMNLNIDAMRAERRPATVTRITRESAPPASAAQATVMPMFTSPRARQEFLEPDTAKRTFDLEIVREHFFRTHIPYGAIIYREARKNNLPPELVAAIVQTESDFRPRLVSHKSAQGLMQIVPETARLLGVRDVYDPEQNIAAGTRYLSYLMRRFGDQRTALAAYNAGETKVARDGIPQYRETLGYIEKVDRRARSYQRRVRNTVLVASRMQAAQ